MPGLLDYVKGYTHGGGVDFDPYAETTQADMLTRLGITITDPEAYGLLPTYDTTGAGLFRDAHKLRGAATKEQATGSLLGLTKQTQLGQAGSMFAGAGASEQAYDVGREDVITGYGQAAHEQYLDLQRDISGLETGYERELLAAVGDLPEDSWSFGETSLTSIPYLENFVTNLPTTNEGTKVYQGYVWEWSEEEGQYVNTGQAVGSLGGYTGGTGSDIRLKKDINYIFTMDNGVPIYTFKYKWSDDVNIGTMAQDIEDMIPEAVSINSNGYKMVDYSKVFNYG